MNQLSYKNRRRANFRMIEAELYSYHESRLELEKLKLDIINQTASGEVVVYTGPGNPTLSKVCSILLDCEIIEQERRCNAIKKALVKLEQNYPDAYKLVEHKYFAQTGSDRCIQEKTNISDRTFYRWRRYVISLIAAELGWKV